MDSKELIRDELKAIESRLNALARQKEADQLRQITNRLQTTAAQMEHDRKAAAYLAWAESKAYIDELKEQVQTQGITATNPVSMPWSAFWCHSSRRYISMPNSRERASTGSPRMRRRTTSFLRLALQRLTSGAAPVELRSPSAAPGLTTFFSIGCLLEQEIYIISVSKKTGAAI